MTDVSSQFSSLPNRLNVSVRQDGGELVMRLDPIAETSRLGSVRASVLGYLIDVVGGVAVDDDVDFWTFTSEMTIRAPRRPAPAFVEGRARVLRHGVRSSTCEVRMIDQAGDPFGFGVLSFARVPRRDSDPTKRVFDVTSAAAAWNSVPPIDVPLPEAVGIAVLDAAGGVVEVDIRDELRNPAGAMQGAIVAHVGEVAAEVALSARQGRPVLVVDLDVRYLAQVRVGPVRTRAVRLGGEPDAWVLVELSDRTTGELQCHVLARGVPA